jgi:hypothetical protein
MQTKIQFKKLKEIFENLRELPYDSLLLVFDKNFFALNRKILSTLVSNLGQKKKIHIYRSSSGEKSKEFEYVQKLCEYFL